RGAAAPRRLLARRQLPFRRPDLPARQPAPARAAPRRAHQAAAARALRHRPGAQPDLRAPEPAIRARDLDAIYVCGPGHGGPGVVANAYLEGTYSELYPHVTLDEDGLQVLFR